MEMRIGMSKKNRFLMDEDYNENDKMIDDNDIDDYYVEDAPVRRRKNRKHVAATAVVAVGVYTCSGWNRAYDSD